ncbi:D-alanyl-D-alanine carboxypeptidase/D-alanyl-D-alanine-endopeptidase [Streptomyces antioxidans]|uniref:D-alanyl-D-alanine carboxypeptidase/D-alanyl-D-alanine-endopeptidase n=1 Tax=Streptomyces antioxidans TaxID=1507734 RepID=A0A1V4DA04_9ACTN|nr:D-alanyl-D-alanine carboxypeptidase/D-alanyl-D-alanine-endopeptidase [Streptomyces antioxidans]OPF82640.1 D-alanyl-D-alanine carboxypeptidase/D-alanyl-D-alanine-endopeptidase [Streptomyces antioxidans]
MNRPRRPLKRRASGWIWPLAIPLVIGLAFTLTWSSPAGADASRAPIGDAIDTILADPLLKGGAAGVVVADADSGAVLYRHRPDDRLMPASNTKLFTSAAAMGLLGPDHRFRTDVLTDGSRHGRVLRGDLYLRGTGDPTMLAGDYDRLAKGVADAGITKVSGRLIADDTRFDAQRVGRSWAADDESSYYAAQISALTLAPDTDYDAGSVIVEVTPGAATGDRPKVTVTPPNAYVRIDNRATTGSGGLTVERQHGSNTITVSGALPAGAATAKEWVSVWAPTGYATSVFADALERHGVRVAGPTRLGRAAPADARTVASHRSMPLREMLVPFMKLSNNIHAEALTKAIGYATAGRGTWDAGLAAIADWLKKRGVDSGEVRQVDGSGLSRMDNIAAGRLTELLLSVRDEPWYPDWYASLPVACAPDRFVGGTLRTRMCSTPAAGNARGKTGSLTGASALSGYVTDADGRELVYSVVLNNYLAASVKNLEDAIVVTLAASGEGHAEAVRPRAVGGATGAEAAEADAGRECSWSKPRSC